LWWMEQGGDNRSGSGDSARVGGEDVVIPLAASTDDRVGYHTPPTSRPIVLPSNSSPRFGKLNSFTRDVHHGLSCAKPDPLRPLTGSSVLAMKAKEIFATNLTE
jgi:hypothetical protein